jgi:hypothetical protein
MEIPTTTIATKLQASGAAMSAAAAVLALTIATARSWAKPTILHQQHLIYYLEGTSVMSMKDDLAKPFARNPLAGRVHTRRRRLVLA